jgi:3-methyladenine DNA glycosylase AlkD
MAVRTTKKSAAKGAGAVRTSPPRRVQRNVRKSTPIKASSRVPRPPLADAVEEHVREALSSLEQMGTQRDRENLPRFGITATKAFGVSVTNIRALAKRLGRSHQLAAALWDTGWYEARMLASFVDEPARVRRTQMERWCRDFDNWAICDTLCLHLFDRTPHAWAKVAEWSDKRDEFVKRAAFALLASLATHDKRAADEPFVEGLRLIERAATDDRNFVKKGVSWALRRIGRRNSALNEAAVKLARRLLASAAPAARWVGRDALKELTSPAVTRQLGTLRAAKR